MSYIYWIYPVIVMYTRDRVLYFLIVMYFVVVAGYFLSGNYTDTMAKND